MRLAVEIFLRKMQTLRHWKTHVLSLVIGIRMMLKTTWCILYNIFKNIITILADIMII